MKESLKKKDSCSIFISMNGHLDGLTEGGWGCSGAGAGPGCTFPCVHYFYVHK